MVIYVSSWNCLQCYVHLLGWLLLVWRKCYSLLYPTLRMSECWNVLQFFGHRMGFVVDVLTTRQVLCLYIGWSGPIVILHVADVIATVMYLIGRCYCHILVGWCYCHSWYVIRLVADGVLLKVHCAVYAFYWWPCLLAELMYTLNNL